MKGDRNIEQHDILDVLLYESEADKPPASDYLSPR